MKSISLYLLRYVSILSLTITSPMFAATPDAYEPDNSKDDATKISAGVSTHHSISPANDHDWVRFTLTTTENIELSTTGIITGGGDLEVTLYDDHLAELGSDYGYPHANLQVNGLPPGTYYAKFNERHSTYEIPNYNISLKIPSGSGDSYEPDDTPDNATPVTSGEYKYHSIIPANDHDWVKFTLATTENIELSTTGIITGGGDLEVTLYDDHLAELGSDYGYPHANLQVNGLPPGTYYAKFNERHSTYEIPDYTLVLQGNNIVAPPNKPNKPTASDGAFSNRVKITWTSKSGLSYKIYRCNNTSTSSCVKIGQSSSPYNDTGAIPGIAYYYRIKACNSVGCSVYSNYDKGLRKKLSGASRKTMFQYLLEKNE